MLIKLLLSLPPALVFLLCTGGCQQCLVAQPLVVSEQQWLSSYSDQPLGEVQRAVEYGRHGLANGLAYDLRRIPPVGVGSASWDVLAKADLANVGSAFELSDWRHDLVRIPPIDSGAESIGLWGSLASDHREFYSASSLQWLGAGLLVGAAIANSPADRELYSKFQSGVRGATSDEWSESLHANKELGNGMYALPVMAAAFTAGKIWDDVPVASALGHWGERSMRSFLAGAPPLLLTQYLTGAGRPGESNYGSHWRPFSDANGVSGHSFMSALPFINAAKMTENRWAKSAFYVGSLIGPMSRINDEAHYPSQAALGWWFAYVAATAIDRSDRAHGRWHCAPYLAQGGGGGLQIECTY
ncbi:MAG: hypothetical protein KDB14_06430 [Planctomycetales bacterium]|nr:hypothetical protein [Planctomycetales bacterium]